jgi:hypothetical protein
MAETVTEPDPDLLAKATAWVEANTGHETRSKRGAVSFEFGEV